MSDNSHGLTECELETTEQRLANCVGSDRFGWFSEYNPGDTVSDCEQLLRRRLTYLYRLLNVESPKGSRKNNFLFSGVEAPVSQGARSAKDLSGTNLLVRPVGVKPMDGLNNSQPI